MFQKTGIIVFIVLFSAYGVSAGLGVISEQDTKRIGGLETNLTLELLNLGDKSREVTLKFQRSENYRIAPNPVELELEPSEVRNFPDQGRWFSLGDGRYASLRPVTVALDINTSSPVRNFSIPVSVTSTPLKGEEIFNTGQKVYQQREMVFNVYTESDLLQTSEGVLYDEGRLFDANDSEAVVDETVNSSNSSTGSSLEKPEKGLTEESENQGEAVNTWTLIMVAGILLSLGVIWSEL